MRKRHIAALLAAAMLASLFPGSVFAAEENELARLPDEPAAVAVPEGALPEDEPMPEPETAVLDPEGDGPAQEAPADLTAEAAEELAVVDLPGDEGAPALLAAEGEEGSGVPAIRMSLTREGQPCGSLYFTTRGTEATLATAEDLTGAIKVPESFKHDGTTYRVTEVGRDALCNQTAMTQIWLPNGLEEIGSRAFAGCDHLKAVGSYVEGGEYDPYALPDGLTEIHEKTFYGCTRLSSVRIGARVTDIWHYAFAYCYSLGQRYTDAAGVTYGVYFDQGSRLHYINQGAFMKCIVLDNITLPNTLETIGPNAFESCTAVMERDGEQFYVGLKDLVIPDGVKRIGEKAFMYCYTLDTLSIPATVETIEDKAFYSCSHLRELSFRGTGSKSIEMGTMVFYWCRMLERIDLPANLRVLPAWTFAYAAYYSHPDVVLPEGMQEVGQYAFNESGIKSITFPESLDRVKMLAFGDCHGLQTINWAKRENNTPISLGMMAFTDCENLTALTLPRLDASSGDNLFYDCDNLRTVTLGEGTTYIPESAFRDCDTLTTVKLSESLTTIDERAFYDCPSLVNVDLAQAPGLTDIGELAFCRTALKSVTIPASVARMGKEAFGINRALMGFTVAENSAGGYYAEKGVLYQAAGGQVHLVRYPAGVTDTTFAIPDEVTHIDYGACSHSEHLVTVTFPEGLEEIGSCAFSHCVNLKNAVVGKDVEQGEWVFDGCFNLSTVTIPEGTVVIGGGGDFKDFPALTKATTVNIPASVRTIRSSSYSKRDENDQLIHLPGSPFQNLLDLESFTVDPRSESFTAVDGVLFTKDGTTLISYPPAKAGEAYTVPDGVTTIVPDAFMNAADLERVTLPESVENVGTNAFVDASALQQVDIYRDFTDIDATGDYSVGYARLFYGNAAGLQVNVQGDPDSPEKDGFIKKFAAKSGCKELAVHIGFIRPAVKAGDCFRENGVIYTLVDDRSVKVGANPNYAGTQVSIPGQVEHDGRSYAVTAIEAGAFTGTKLTFAAVMLELTGEQAAAIFGGNVTVTTRKDLTAFSLSDNELTYGDALVVNTPAGLAEGAQVTLTGPGGKATASIRGGAAVFSAPKALYDAAGSNGKVVTVTLSCGAVSTQAELTVSPKVFTPEHYKDQTAEMRFYKNYDGSTAVDVVTAKYLDYFTVPGDDLAFRLTGVLPKAEVSNQIYPFTSDSLSFVGADARFYAIDSAVRCTCGVEHGQLYIKEVDGVLQKPKFLRAWSPEDGMRIRDCGLGGGQFVAYIPTKVENGQVTEYETVDVEGSIIYTDENPYDPALPDISYLPVSPGGVYHWSFCPEGNGGRQEELKNYRFDGSFMPWDPSLSKTDETLIGEAGENPLLPGFVKPEKEEPEPSAPAQPDKANTDPAQGAPNEPKPMPTPAPTPAVKPSGGSSSGGSSSGGGGSSGGGSSGGSGGKSAAVKVSDSTVARAVSAAEKGGPVVLKADTSGGTAAMAVKLTAKNLKAIADNGSGGVTLQSSVAEVALDGKALELVKGNGSQDAVVSVRRLDKTALPQKAVKSVGSAPVYDLSVTSGKKTISDFGEGSIQVSIPCGNVQSSTGDLMACRVEEDGTLTPVVKSAVMDGKMLFQVNHLSTYALVEPSAQFQDAEAHWARKDVAFNAARGIMIGTDREHFRPDEPTTVAAAVTVLGRLSGVEDAAKAADWAKPHLAWAEEAGILPEGLAPNGPISREALAYLLAHYMGPGEGEDVAYTDLEDIDADYLSSVRRVRKLGLMQGRPDNSFDPRGSLTRGELAAVLHRVVLAQLRGTSDGAAR